MGHSCPDFRYWARYFGTTEREILYWIQNTSFWKNTLIQKPKVGWELVFFRYFELFWKALVFKNTKYRILRIWNFYQNTEYQKLGWKIQQDFWEHAYLKIKQDFVYSGLSRQCCRCLILSTIFLDTTNVSTFSTKFFYPRYAWAEKFGENVSTFILCRKICQKSNIEILISTCQLERFFLL